MTQTAPRFLVGYGKTAGIGLFRADAPLACARGEPAVVHTSRGLELGQVLCPADDRHARLLGTAPEGELLRLATSEDHRLASFNRQQEQALFEHCQRFVSDGGFPAAILDVEILLDGQNALLQLLSWAEWDSAPLLEDVGRRYGLSAALENVTPLAEVETEHGGCGKPNCGHGGGGCDSCSTGGCSTGCGSGKVDMREYFAHLRTQMEEKHRVPLL
jgi:hypothetical protein